MKTSEESRGNALQRTLTLLSDLMRGRHHDKHSAAKLMGLSTVAADRQLSAMARTVPGVTQTTSPTRARMFTFDHSKVLTVARPSKQAVVAACFGASLSAMFDGTYRSAMRQPLEHMAKKRRKRFAEVDRKFWFVRRGGEGALPEKEHLLDELIDALLEQDVTEIEYEHFDGSVDRIQIRPLSVVIYDHQLYFIAQNEDQEIRSYRFARTLAADRLDEHFEYPDRTTYDPDQLLRDSFGIFTGDDYPVENVRVRLSVRWCSFVKTHRWHPSQRRLPHTVGAADGVELHFRLRLCPEFENWLLSFGDELEVLEPESLRGKIATRLQNAAGLYEHAAAVSRKSRG